MNGQRVLNNTLKVNALFSMFSGIDFIVFDQSIGRVLTSGKFDSLAPTGYMLIGFSLFVFIVSMLKNVNKYLVGAIITMDVLWVIASAFTIILSAATFTTTGLFAIGLVAAIIGLFAYFQTKGLRLHLKTHSA